jgi:putative transposase
VTAPRRLVSVVGRDGGAACDGRQYCPAFPGSFGSIEDARAFCKIFFDYYNHEHRHSGIGLDTPASVHYGTAAAIREQRAVVLDAAFAAHPDRFHGRARPRPSCPPPPGSTTHPAKNSSTTNENRLSQTP